MKLVKNIEVKDFKKGFDLKWNNLNDINILIGASGTGKTWLFDKLYGFFNKRHHMVKCEYYKPFDEEKDNINHLTFENNINMYYGNIPKLDSVEDGNFVADFLNEHFFKEDDNKVVYSDISNHLWIKNNNFRVSILSDNQNKLLYFFSKLYKNKDIENTLVFIDSFFDTLGIFTQQEICNLMLEFNPNAQYFVITQSPFIFNKNGMVKNTIGIKGLLVKNEEVQG